MGRPAASNVLALHQLPGELFTAEDVECEKWYECVPNWPEGGSGGLRGSQQEWLTVATSALTYATRSYDKKIGDGTTSRALGKEQTVGDRIASVTLRVQESPVHRVEDLRLLLSFANKKGRRERLPAIEALKDLFVNDLLPPDRRLIALEDRELKCSAAKPISKRQLAYALFESQLKAVYREFLGILEECGKDTLVHFKEKAVRTISELLIAKPECEKELLSMLVNKLGDPDRKVSSTASYSLRQLIEKHHPQMRLIVVREVEQLLVRPNVTPRAQYFSVIFLNQIRFTKDDVDLARWLLRIYMELFTKCLAREKKNDITKEGNEKRKGGKQKGKAKKARWKKKGQLNPTVSKKDISPEAKESRLMGALLIGANRAFPYTKPEEDETSYEEHFDTLFQVAHAHALGPATQSLSFLLQVSQSNATQSDRFYRALYSRIYDAAGAGDPKQACFLNLLYKAMKADTDLRRVKAYAKRLLQAALNGTPGFAGACAVVISECFKGRQYGVLKSFISIGESDDGVEHFVDVDKENEEKEQGATGDGADESIDVHGKVQLTNATIVSAEAPGKVDAGGSSGEGKRPSGERYDMSKRDPQYAGAERSCLWELVTLSSHYHPSVSTFASTMCGSFKSIQYGGDPLKDFSEISFLDKFVYKKPKNRVAKSLYGKRSASFRDDPVANSVEFQELARAGNIGADEKFFVRFFDANPDRIVCDVDEEQVNAKDREGKVVDLDEEFEAESEEEAFEKAMQAEMRRLGADVGFASDGIKKEIADVDEEDEDELQAFEEAFGKDMVPSDGEQDRAREVKLQKPEENDNDLSEDEDERPQPKKRRAKQRKGSSSQNNESDSVFAAAEDFREAIDAEASRAERERNKNSEGEVKVPGGRQGVKRRRDKKIGPRKKRKST